MRNKGQNMLQGSILRGLIAFAVPVMLTNILQLLFNAADLVVVGQFCGSNSIGAVGATGSITTLMVNFFLGLASGVSVTVARNIGARQDEAVHRVVHTAMPIALICGGFLTVLGVVFCNDFLVLMGTPENLLPLSTVYMQIYFGGITFTMVYNFNAAILRASGDTKSPFLFLSLAGVVNVVLNVIFVTVFHMDVAGVALATVISKAVAAILVTLALIKRSDSCKLVLRKMRIYSKQLAEILHLGIPASIQSAVFQMSNVLIQSSVNSFGDVFVSGCSAAANIGGFIVTPANAFYQAAVSFVGQNVGAKNYNRVKKIIITGIGSVTVFCLTTGLLAAVFGKSLLSIYISDSAEAIGYGYTRLLFMYVPCFLLGIMDTLTGCLRGMGNSVVPMILSILGVCGFRIGWIYTVFQIPRFHTPEGLFSSYVVSWIMTASMLLVALVVTFKKKQAEAKLDFAKNS